MVTFKKIIGSFCLVTIVWIIGLMFYQAIKEGDQGVIVITILIVFCLLVYGAVWGLSKEKP